MKYLGIYKKFLLLIVISNFIFYYNAFALNINKVDFHQVKGWTYDSDFLPSILALERTCEVFSQKKSYTYIGTRAFRLYVGDFHNICANVWKIHTNKDAKKFFETNFNIYRIVYKSLVTGYFQVEMRGAKIKTSRYKYPLYLIPKKIVGTQCLISPGEVIPEVFCLYNKKLVKLQLIYIEDINDLNILRLQGSGKIILPDGELIRVKYASKYSKVSNTTKVHYIDNNEGMELLKVNNQRRKEPIIVVNMGKGRTDPKGSAGIELTPMGSVAVDHKYYPYGLPIWLDLRKYSYHDRFRQMAIAQDTGSAIRGKARIDFYWGTGHRAGRQAYNMTYRGFVYVLYPKISIKSKKFSTSNRIHYYERQGPRFMDEFRGIKQRHSSKKQKMSPCTGCIFFNQKPSSTKYSDSLTQLFLSTVR